jgi:hypothetical protein
MGLSRLLGRFVVSASTPADAGSGADRRGASELPCRAAVSASRLTRPPVRRSSPLPGDVGGSAGGAAASPTAFTPADDAWLLRLPVGLSYGDGTNGAGGFAALPTHAGSWMAAAASGAAPRPGPRADALLLPLEGEGCGHQLWACSRATNR